MSTNVEDIRTREVQSIDDMLKTQDGFDEATLDEILQGFNELNANKQATSVRRTTNDQPIARKKTLAEIDKAIIDIQDSIVNREKAITDQYKEANEWYDKYEELKHKYTAAYEKRRAEILLAANTKDSLQALIIAKENEISDLKKRIDENDFRDEVSPEIEAKLKEAKLTYIKHLKTAESQWKVYADNKVNKTILGIHDDGKKTRRGMVEMLADDKAMLNTLMSERNAIMNEKQKPVEQMESELMGSDDKTKEDLEELFNSMDSNPNPNEL